MEFEMINVERLYETIAIITVFFIWWVVSDKSWEV